MGISAFIGRGVLGLGLGLAAAFYFLNIVANLTESADIIADGRIEVKYLAVGIVLTVIGIGTAFWKYLRKDIS